MNLLRFLAAIVLTSMTIIPIMMSVQADPAPLLPISPSWSIIGDEDSALLGASVSTAGDVNGDGYDEVIVGAHDYSHYYLWEGRAYVYYGSPNGLSTTPNWMVEGGKNYASMGFSVSTAGDVNGDGYDDVIVGAPLYDNSGGYEGRVFVYYGSPAGLHTTPDWTAEGPQSSSYFGYSVETAGDVNGDGYDDMIIGAPFWNGGGQKGRVYVYFGSPAGLSTTPSWVAEIDEPDGRFGYSVSTAGDVNGDGYDDVIISTSKYITNVTFDGKVYVYYGSKGGLSATPDWIVEDDQYADEFGSSVSNAGDVNGDGNDDVIVGAPSYVNELGYTGRAFAYYGSPNGLSTTPDWTIGGYMVGSYFGCSVHTAGDVNGDGYADVIGGAPLYFGNNGIEGKVSLFYGSASGLSSSPSWVVEGNRNNSAFGGRVGTTGDVNGSNLSGVIVGAPMYCGDPASFCPGAVFAYYDAALPGPTRTPRHTPTPTITPTATSSPIRTSTKTSTSTRTPTRTYTPTRTPTQTSTPTQTATATYSSTPTATETPTTPSISTVTSTSTQTLTPTSPPTEVYKIDLPIIRNDHW